MTHRTFILSLLAAVALLLTPASPAMAARLATVSVQAGAQQASQSGDFRLGEQTRITINFDASVQDDGSAAIHVYQKLPNGRWQRISTPLSTNRSRRDRHEMTLPAGDYRIEATATHARLSLTVDH